jgi:hypothetical protein
MTLLTEFRHNPLQRGGSAHCVITPASPVMRTARYPAGQRERSLEIVGGVSSEDYESRHTA